MNDRKARCRAFFLQPFTGIQHSFVLGSGDDKVISFGGISFKDTFENRVDGLCRAGRENNFRRFSTDEIRDFFPGDFYRFGSLPSVAMG